MTGPAGIPPTPMGSIVAGGTVGEVPGSVVGGPAGLTVAGVGTMDGAMVVVGDGFVLSGVPGTLAGIIVIVGGADGSVGRPGAFVVPSDEEPQPVRAQYSAIVDHPLDEYESRGHSAPP